jgi:hypothetical protein
MCPSCCQFVIVDIKSSQQLQALHHRLFFSGVKPGVLVIEDGDLQWSDSMECVLRCTACGQRFKLSFCRGGSFGPIDVNV